MYHLIFQVHGFEINALFSALFSLKTEAVNRRTTSINKQTTIAITAQNDRTDLESPIWAINWFNLKRPKLYTFYNVLVFPHLKKVGGRAHFKGYVKEKVEGSAEFDRQMLLIVKYPTADAFLRMVANKLFLLKSILRLKSVSQFIFGFTQRIGEQPESPAKPSRYVGKNRYLAHLFQGAAVSEDDIRLLKPLLSQYNITNYFSGLKTATISRTNKAGEQVQPFFVDGVLLLEASSGEAFDLLLKDPVFEAFKNKQTANNIYQIKRILWDKVQMLKKNVNEPQSILLNWKVLF